MKKFKNNKTEPDSWVGQLIEPGAYYTIENFELFKWQNDSKVLADIASGKGIMNDGTSDITDVASAINFLKDEDPTPRDDNGSPLFKQKISRIGWNYQIHGLEFKTCQLDSIHSKFHDNSVNGSDFGFTTIKVFKDNGSGILIQCSDQIDADINGIATQVDWEPTHDIEIIGGILKHFSAVPEDVRIWIIGAPDIPADMGGSKYFVTNINLKYISVTEGIKIDGRTPKKLSYDPISHSNKIRLFFRHPAGHKHDIHTIFEFFKP